jgi:hypothetical protein
MEEHPHVHVVGSDKRHDAKPTATSTAQAASTVMDSLDLACEQSQYLRKEEPARLQTAKHLEMLMQHARRADPNAGSREQYLEMISQALLLRVAQLRMRDGVEAPVSGFETLSVQPTDKDEASCILRAAEVGDDEAIRTFALKRRPLSVRNHSGQTPLMLAARYGHEQVVTLLLIANEDVNAVDNNGNDALQLAIAHGHEAVFDTLLRAGADPDRVLPTVIAAEDDQMNEDPVLSSPAQATLHHPAATAATLLSVAPITTSAMASSAASAPRHLTSLGLAMHVNKGDSMIKKL